MIRKATAQDVPALRAFQKQFYGEWFDSYHADIVQAVISSFVWVAELDGQIVGYQLCELFGPQKEYFPNSIFLSEIFVDSPYRKQGIASRLIKIALEEHWPLEYDYFSLTHDSDELFLTNFYTKFGFVECGKTGAGNIMMKRPR